MCQRCRFFLDASCVAHFCNLQFFWSICLGSWKGWRQICTRYSIVPVQRLWKSTNRFGSSLLHRFLVILLKYTINIWPQGAVLPWLISVHLEGLAWELFIWTVFGREGSWIPTKPTCSGSSSSSSTFTAAVPTANNNRGLCTNSIQ